MAHAVHIHFILLVLDADFNIAEAHRGPTEAVTSATDAGVFTHCLMLFCKPPSVNLTYL